ncbi:S-norcoclaurine synthase-like [Melia azedarach]|uniref:S-norcoclaurine synthase-like n=1 Tax=Melia azedarach TaxID=155640 RepID=A0ACC1YCK6_MELAZ|nr:S-norcoclaurine synthase-like [Melia azedarach]
MKGEVSHELEVNVPAGQAWELYSTNELAKLAEKEVEHIEKIELEGDGGVGTIAHLIFAPGTPGVSSYKEKFTKVDDEKRVKETEGIEGGYMDLGFTLFRAIFEIIEKGNDSCIIKSTIQYEVKEEAAANVQYVSIQPLANIAEIAKNYLIKNKA